MLVMMQSAGEQTLVLSKRPPSPTSMTLTWVLWLRKANQPMALVSSKKVG